MFLAWTSKNTLCDFERETVGELADAIVSYYFHHDLGEPEVKILMSNFDDREVEHDVAPFSKLVHQVWVNTCIDNGMSPNHHIEGIQRSEHREAKARGEF